MKKFFEKITLPIAIVISAVVLAVGFYFVQYNKQQSIERQQRIDLEAERIKSQEESLVEQAKVEQTKKEYLADRKNDCLNIYKTESDKWNNVRGWRFSEEDDRCYIRYKNNTPLSDEECDKKYPTDGALAKYFFNDSILCKSGEFENSF